MVGLPGSAVDLSDGEVLDVIGRHQAAIDGHSCVLALRAPAIAISPIPVGRAATYTAGVDPKTAIALDVGRGGVFVEVECDLPFFVVPPKVPKPSAYRAVARAQIDRKAREREANLATVTAGLIRRTHGLRICSL